MTRWADRASERLRDRETIEASVPIDENGVVVTSQRVFAFTPASDGPNFRSIERPNVERVATDSTSAPGWLGYAARAGLGGIAGVALGLTVDFGGLLDVGDLGAESAGGVGTGGMLTVLQQVSRLLGMLDDALLVTGLLALAVALGAFGKYLESRTKTVRIRVAGEADLHVPATDPRPAVTQLRRHLAGDADPPTPVEGSAEPTAVAGPTVEDPVVEESTAENPAVEDRASGMDGAEPAERGMLGTILDSLRTEPDPSNDRTDEE